MGSFFLKGFFFLRTLYSSIIYVSVSSSKLLVSPKDWAPHNCSSKKWTANSWWAVVEVDSFDDLLDLRILMSSDALYKRRFRRQNVLPFKRNVTNESAPGHACCDTPEVASVEIPSKLLSFDYIKLWVHIWSLE